MALRGKKPEAIQKRLKLFTYSRAGIGKTTAAIQFPNAYIIDCERGAENYDKIINASNSVVYQTNDMSEIIAEVKNLLTERHEYRTLVIDPITTAYNALLDKCEQKVGSEFGRHYGAANKEMKRLYNLLMQLDMNVIVTAHAKTLYGDNLKVVGETFDGWKQLDYAFDLVVELAKGKDKKRIGRVVKTRIETFPDGDAFEWSYAEIARRYGAATIERQAAVVLLASPAQVQELNELLSIVRLPDGVTEKWMTKANVDSWDDMPAEAIAKCIQYVKDKLPASATAAA